MQKHKKKDDVNKYFKHWESGISFLVVPRMQGFQDILTSNASLYTEKIQRIKLASFDP